MVSFSDPYQLFFSVQATGEKLFSFDYIEKILVRTISDVWLDFLSHIPFLLAGFLILVITWLFAQLMSSISKRILLRARLRRSLKELLIRLVTISVWLLGLLLTAMVVFPGLTPAKAIGGLGVASLAIGFAFKEVFENFFAGILLLWRFPMEPGDYIECQGIMGRIEDITVRMTTIRQVTGELTVVPNSFLFKNPLDILTGIPKRRTGIVVGIGYDEDVTGAVNVIEDALRNCATIAGDKPVQVFPQGFGNSSIDIEVVWWTDPDPVDLRRSRGEVVTAIKQALDKHEIEIPFPHRTLVFKNAIEVAGTPTAD